MLLLLLLNRQSLEEVILKFFYFDLSANICGFVRKYLRTNIYGLNKSQHLVITDFENAMVVAAQNVFPDAHVTGCYFRFAQTLFKKWTEYNLGVIYGNEKSQAGNIARMTFRFFDFCK